MDWQDHFLTSLVAFDLEEGPHGLYGIRESYASEGKPLPTLEKILWSRHPAGFVERFGFGDHLSRRIQTGRLIVAEDRPVTMKFLNLASTKVRRFGATYLLDKATPKREFEPDWDITKELTHFSKSKTKSRFRCQSQEQCVLLIAHAPRLDAVHQFLGQVRAAAFLIRYELVFHEREWPDQHDRGFSTGLYLWSTVMVGNNERLAPIEVD